MIEFNTQDIMDTAIELISKLLTAIWTVITAIFTKAFETFHNVFTQNMFLLVALILIGWFYAILSTSDRKKLY